MKILEKHFHRREYKSAQPHLISLMRKLLNGNVENRYKKFENY